jgi:hypothetical protein
LGLELGEVALVAPRVDADPHPLALIPRKTAFRATARSWGGGRPSRDSGYAEVA